jgi:chromosome partitioning protein
VTPTVNRKPSTQGGARVVPVTQTLVFAAHKGGAGKTTAAVNVAGCAAELGRKVLLVDVDPQGAATAAIGGADTKPTLYEVLAGRATIDEAVRPTSVKGLDVLPADLDLAGAELELPRRAQWQTALRNALAPSGARWDLVLLDSAPGLGVLPFVALAAADRAVVTSPPTFLSVRAMRHLLATVEQAAGFAPGLEVLGIVPSIVGRRSLHRDEAMAEMANRWPKLMLPELPDRVVFADAAVAGQPVVVYAPTSPAANAVRVLTKEVLKRAKPPRPS